MELRFIVFYEHGKGLVSKPLVLHIHADASVVPMVYGTDLPPPIRREHRRGEQVNDSGVEMCHF